MKQELDYNFFSSSLSKIDPLISSAIELELQRQKDQIELIASENIVSQAVLEAQDRCSQINMQKDIQTVVIMAGANLLIKLKNLQ